jgi:hypothetical protein
MILTFTSSSYLGHDHSSAYLRRLQGGAPPERMEMDEKACSRDEHAASTSFQGLMDLDEETYTEG